MASKNNTYQTLKIEKSALKMEMIKTENTHKPKVHPSQYYVAYLLTTFKMF